MSTRRRFTLNTVLMALCTVCSCGLMLRWGLWGVAPITAVFDDEPDSGFLFVLAAYLVFAGMSIRLCVVDMVEQRLPNILVFPLTGVLMFLLCAAAQFGFDRERIIHAFVAAGAMGALFLLAGILAQGTLGGGDIKLSVALGLLLGSQGWQQWIIGSVLMLIVAPVTLVFCSLWKRSLFRDGMPFGPWMLGCTWIGIVSGSPLLRN